MLRSAVGTLPGSFSQGKSDSASRSLRCAHVVLLNNSLEQSEFVPAQVLKQTTRRSMYIAEETAKAE